MKHYSDLAPHSTDNEVPVCTFGVSSNSSNAYLHLFFLKVLSLNFHNNFNAEFIFIFHWNFFKKIELNELKLNDTRVNYTLWTKKYWSVKWLQNWAIQWICRCVRMFSNGIKHVLSLNHELCLYCVLGHWSCAHQRFLLLNSHSHCNTNDVWLHYFTL